MIAYNTRQMSAKQTHTQKQHGNSSNQDNVDKKVQECSWTEGLLLLYFFLHIILWGSSCCTKRCSHAVKVIRCVTDDGHAPHPRLSWGFKFHSISILDQFLFSLSEWGFRVQRHKWLTATIGLGAVFCVGFPVYNIVLVTWRTCDIGWSLEH